jgi:hypothetical protein
MQSSTRTPFYTNLFALAAGWLFGFSPILAAERVPMNPRVDNEHLFMELRLHTPNQMAAFYTARGFNEASVARLSDACFVTAHVDNKSDSILWLELDNWSFSNADGEIKRLDRDDWNAVWNETGLTQANRSTFGWTQLPDVRDLQPGEPVGGNIVLPRTGKPFSIEAHFHTGKYKRKGLVVVRFRDLRCADDIEGVTTQ